MVYLFALYLIALLSVWWIPYFIWKNDTKFQNKIGMCFFWVNIPFYYFMIAPSFLEQPRLNEVTSNISIEIIRWLGFLFLLYGFSVTLWMFKHKAKKGKPGYNPPQLIKSGIFSYIRHPQISGAFFLSLGMACWQGTIHHLILNILYAIILIIQTTMEEHFLLIPSFPEEYVEYKKQSKAFIPFLL